MIYVFGASLQLGRVSPAHLFTLSFRLDTFRFLLAGKEAVVVATGWEAVVVVAGYETVAAAEEITATELARSESASGRVGISRALSRLAVSSGFEVVFGAVAGSSPVAVDVGPAAEIGATAATKSNSAGS